MNCIYWNARGLANSPSRLALKRLVISHMPDFVFISKPWMNAADLSVRFLSNLQLKIFAFNNKNALLPNLWCLCKLYIDHVIISSDMQQVSITVTEENKPLELSAIYASTNY